MKSSMSPLAAVGLLAVCVGASGCILLEARKDQKELARWGWIKGNVEVEHESSRPLVVVLFPAFELEQENPEDLIVTDHFIRVGAGSYGFRVEPGEFVLAAFEDLNEDGNYDADEPLFSPREDGPFSVKPGETVIRDLVIPTEGRSRTKLEKPIDIEALQTRGAAAQLSRSLGAFIVRGEVADLSDERYGSANGQLGLPRPLEFVTRGLAGIYFTEAYDPQRIPVLFVHGISGYPQEFSELIDSLDRERFQAWFFFYPSGGGSIRSP